MIKKYKCLEELKNDLDKKEELYLYYNYSSDESEIAKVYKILEIDHLCKSKLTIKTHPCKLNFIKCFDSIGAYCSISELDLQKEPIKFDLTIKNENIYGIYKYKWNDLIETDKNVYKIITKDEIVKDCAMKY